MKVIVVEDIEITNAMLAALLDSQPGVEVTGAFLKPSEAVLSLHHQTPDAAFIDINLPGMSGIELTRQLRLKHPDLPVVFVTAHKEYAVDAFAVEAVDYILKPVQAESVQRSVERLQRRLEAKSNQAPPETKTPLSCDIQLFGGFEIRDAKSKPVFWSTRRQEELLAILILSDKGISKWTLMDLIWPHSDAKKAENNFNMAIYKIRRTIIRFHLPIRLTVNKGRYRIEFGSDVRIDWEIVRRASYSTSVHDWIEAIHLYDRGFLIDFDSPWFDQQRFHALEFNRAIALNLFDHRIGQNEYDSAAELISQVSRQTNGDAYFINMIISRTKNATDPNIRRLADVARSQFN